MRIAIHQSQYIPWIPYFIKIARADVFVIMDNVQYQKNGVQNRNKIRNKQGDFWLTIPVTGHMSDKINEKPIKGDVWQEKHWKSLAITYSKAEFWDEYSCELEKMYAEPYRFLGEVNYRFLQFVFGRLDINTKIVKLSDLEVAGSKSELVLEICKKLGASTYISGVGAKSYIDEVNFVNNDIKIEYLKSIPPIYKQFNGEFIPGLSVLDMLFNVQSKTIKDCLRG
ncbi:MAG: WbqC family protein [Bacillota bacterium]